MKLCGVRTGDYEGHKFARLYFKEEMKSPGCFGCKFYEDKADYEFVMRDVIPFWDQLCETEITPLYDRYKKVINFV